jgi:hypothetical protein
MGHHEEVAGWRGIWSAFIQRTSKVGTRRLTPGPPGVGTLLLFFKLHFVVRSVS